MKGSGVPDYDELFGGRANDFMFIRRRMRGIKQKKGYVPEAQPDLAYRKPKAKKGEYSEHIQTKIGEEDPPTKFVRRKIGDEEKRERKEQAERLNPENWGFTREDLTYDERTNRSYLKVPDGWIAFPPMKFEPSTEEGEVYYGLAHYSENPMTKKGAHLDSIWFRDGEEPKSGPSREDDYRMKEPKEKKIDGQDYTAVYELDEAKGASRKARRYGWTWDGVRQEFKEPNAEIPENPTEEQRQAIIKNIVVGQNQLEVALHHGQTLNSYANNMEQYIHIPIYHPVIKSGTYNYMTNEGTRWVAEDGEEIGRRQEWSDEANRLATGTAELVNDGREHCEENDEKLKKLGYDGRYTPKRFRAPRVDELPSYMIYYTEKYRTYKSPYIPQLRDNDSQDTVRTHYEMRQRDYVNTQKHSFWRSQVKPLIDAFPDQWKAYKKWWKDKEWEDDEDWWHFGKNESLDFINANKTDALFYKSRENLFKETGIKAEPKPETDA